MGRDSLSAAGDPIDRLLRVRLSPCGRGFSTSSADSVEEMVCFDVLLRIGFCNFLPRGFAAGFDMSGAAALAVREVLVLTAAMTRFAVDATPEAKSLMGENDRDCDRVIRRVMASGGEVDRDSGAAAESDSTSDCEVAVGGDGLGAATFLIVEATAVFCFVVLVTGCAFSFLSRPSLFGVDRLLSPLGDG
jgi:hypothetical protein